MEKIVFINTAKGLDNVLNTLYRVAVVKGKLDVYKEMMAFITTLHNVRPWGEIQKYAEKLGCYIYHGDIPKGKDENYHCYITGIIAKGKILKRILELDDSFLDDEKRYEFNGEYIFPVE